MEDKTQILDKIMKIYNKAKNNPSEHEAKAAVLKVQEMLAKYNLDIHELEGQNNNDVQELSTGEKSRWWHRKLGSIIANNFKCKIYVVTCNGNKIVFVGTSIDVRVCLETFEYVKKSINYSCKLHMAKRRLRNKENIKIAKESFIEGFLQGLNYELKRQKSKNEWGLILSVPVSVQEYYDSMTFLGTVSLNRNNDKKTDDRAFNDGYVKGKEFNLNTDKALIC